MISNKDRKFLSELWKALFKRLNVSLLYFTIYHSQTNESSERINQIMKIALRFYINIILDKSSSWLKILSRLQALLNNFTSLTINKILNEVAYEFNFNIILNLLKSSKKKLEFLIARVSTRNVIVVVNINVKYYYDKRHQSMFLKIED